MFDPTKPIVTLTEAATGHVHRLMARADNDVIGLRVGVKTAGCSGMQYDVQFATEQKPFEDKIEQDGVTLFIDPTAVMFLIGSQMDCRKINFPPNLYLIIPMKLPAVAVVRAFQFRHHHKP